MLHNLCCNYQPDQGHRHLLFMLLALGANPRHADHMGCTPLHVAANRQKEEAIRLLLLVPGVGANSARGLSWLRLPGQSTGGGAHCQHCRTKPPATRLLLAPPAQVRGDLAAVTKDGATPLQLLEQHERSMSDMCHAWGLEETAEERAEYLRCAALLAGR